jgi:uncharacterized OB-fold protein
MPHRSSVPIKWRLSKKGYPKIYLNNGVVVSFTIIRNAPAGFASYAPYVVGIVDFGGVKTTGQVVGPIENIKIGSKIKPVFRRCYEDGASGVIDYVVKYEAV